MDDLSAVFYLISIFSLGASVALVLLLISTHFRGRYSIPDNHGTKLSQLTNKSDAHQVLVPIYTEHRHKLGKTVSESLKEMRDVSDMLYLSDLYPDVFIRVCHDVLKHEGFGSAPALSESVKGDLRNE